MDAIYVMSRKEVKYLLTQKNLEKFKNEISKYMIIDNYGLTSIVSLYYDTPDYKLIRNSLDKPLFKEKIRLRSYGLPNKNSKVYLELKRKYKGIVYKRRISTNIETVDKFINDGIDLNNNQIEKEISYFRKQNVKLIPSAIIIYDRLAYYSNNSDLRITIDQNPRYRVDDLNICSSLEGKSLLNDGEAILEIKVQNALPLWLIEILEKLEIKKISFSKYGEAYKKELSKNYLDKLKEKRRCLNQSLAMDINYQLF